MLRLLAIAVATAACWAATGCAKHTKPIVAQPTMTAQQSQFETAWNASQDVLKDCHWPIARADRRDGLLLTEPMTGKHFFEFWRCDAATRADLAESTVQTIYRQVTVRIEQCPDGYQPRVVVDAWRSDRRGMQSTNAANVMRLFTIPGQEQSEQERLPAQDLASAIEGATYLGQDEALAQKLAARICQAMAD